MPQLATPLLCPADAVLFGRVLTRQDILDLLGEADAGAPSGTIPVAGAAASIVAVSISTAGHLIVTLSSGAVLDAGLLPTAPNGAPSPTIASATVNNSGHLILTLTNGSLLDAGAIPTSGAVKPVTTVTYIAGQAISPAFDVVFLNTAAAATFTLGAGVAEGQQIIIKRIGAGANTLALQLDGTAYSLPMATPSAPRESITLLWSAARATWLLV